MGAACLVLRCMLEHKLKIFILNVAALKLGACATQMRCERV
jgi:hypothetical protein